LFQAKLTLKAFALGIILTGYCAQFSSAWAQHAYPAEGQANSLPVLVHNVQKASQTVQSGFAAYDNTPLGQRMPLVLIHGIGGTDSRLFHWENFLQYVSSKPDFQAKYKIYLYHYDSTRSVPAISKNLQQTLGHFLGTLGSQNHIKIVAYSEGGLLVRNALQDAYLDEHTDEVLTIATPFHGSPLANPEWIGQQVKTESAFSLVRMGQKIAYKITGHMYPTFRQDFHWDNFDGAIPMDQYVKNNGPVVTTDYALAKKRNFVTYGSYFGTEVDATVMTQELGLKNPPPKDHPSVGNLFRKNFLFSLIRNNIGKLPLATKLAQPAPAEHSAEKNVLAGAAESVNDQAAVVASSGEDTLMLALAKSAENTSGLESKPELKGQIKVSAVAPAKIAPAVLLTTADNPAAPTMAIKPVSMMMFNDGISPISSTLWLGRYASGNGASIPVDRLWSALKQLKGTRHARLFAGLDHRNWLEGMTRNGEELVQDLLNPDEPPRTVFDWIVYDLMS
jgi:triacylglycerol esterase/lipase EstA (alpha/beta hydrolase family)